MAATKKQKPVKDDPAPQYVAVDSTETSKEAQSEASPDNNQNGQHLVTVEEVEALRLELEQARREKQEMHNTLLYRQADFENIRKRLQKEKEESLQYAVADTIKSLLSVVDDLERVIDDEKLTTEYRDGLKLIHRRMFEVFTRAGLREVDQYDTFDPSMHAALERAPVGKGESDQQILDVYQKGYFFRDRLLRESIVKVAVKN